ncbi:HNH endonuclease [Salipiger thiooxidans]|uniref:HNH endonuclease n=1 Tax=Salipiger thiooxidans TaxID=282683 RepID=UPI001CD1CD5B|nr:HNH endonuclease [Salipiger thiooxidans]MCA0849207.1 HNH endonuclease [Salipiger thiooxidans]
MDKVRALAEQASKGCLQACQSFDGDHFPDLEPRKAREWWAETYTHHSDGLASRIRHYIELSHSTSSGCLILTSECSNGTDNKPGRVHWRGRRQKVYQLVAWGLSGELPTKRSVVRHLCHNRLCIHPEHLKIGTQAQNLLDQKISRAAQWTHL